MANPEKTILAIDAGGTKCDALLVDGQTGNLLARASGSRLDLPEVQFPGGTGRSPAMLELVLKRLFADWHSDGELVVTTSNHLLLPDSLGGNPLLKSYRLTETFKLTEAEASLALIDRSDGIVTLSGTGATITLVLPDGSCRYVDGLGPLIGDNGSAYYIGQTLLRRCVPQTQYSAAPETLPEWRAVMRYFAWEHLPYREQFNALIRFSIENPDRSTVAGLSRVVEELAAAGNDGAAAILEDAARCLADSTCRAIELLPSTPPYPPVVGVGSVLTQGKIVWPRFVAIMRERYPEITPVLPSLPQVAGQVLWYYRLNNSATRAAQTNFRFQFDSIS
ncbi:BadF/BadG/BcrA/BcrD ATPase family protein [Victivallis sp. Marseille-Q1083]|uniref:BadF/BadG/BcrA/BcrD ATPase family protein n=1 Tax=Victivallis sp. Marseille-Q1083 TaxID=2717288 RepID=UPI00158E7771|nr:BadF/BadG/BcrA/BcrD ATPase family protein [Victivallis sp. Marseille-Q1083]